VRSRSRDFLKFCEIIDNMLEMVQHKDKVTTQDDLEIIYGPSKGTIANDLE